MDAYEALVNSSKLASKKYEKKDVEKTMLELAPMLSTLGSNLYQSENFAGSFKAFNAILELKKILNSMGNMKILEKPEDYQDQLYTTGVVALQAEMVEEAGNMFHELYSAGYDKPAVYEALYKVYKESDPDKAIKYLEEGRTKHPDELSLLYTEINHYLLSDQLDALTGKLETAIEKDPENKSLYSTLGNIYDQIYQKSEGKDPEAAQMNFDKAMSYYEQAMAKDPNFLDAVYSIGALYYNKAAALTNELKELESDYSKEGIKKYEAKKSEVYSYFDKALPYFQKSESIDPNDMNTLIALKEIFARKDDFEMSNIFKERLDTVEQGGKVDSSYFNK
jgi:tetratricopeptide (TPR) repeat protein